MQCHVKSPQLGRCCQWQPGQKGAELEPGREKAPQMGVVCLKADHICGLNIIGVSKIPVFPISDSFL